VDASVDVGQPLPCNAGAPFGTPALVAGLPEDGVATATLTDDELELFFASDGPFVSDAGLVGDAHIYRARRGSRSEPFGDVIEVPSLTVGTDQRSPTLTADGLGVYFQATVGTKIGIWTSTRSNGSSTTFSAPTEVAALNTTTYAAVPSLTRSGSALYFSRGDASALHVFRALASQSFAVAAPLSELDTPGGEVTPVPTPDDLGLYYSKKTGDLFEIWFARRATTSAAYTSFERLGALNAGTISQPAWASSDGCRLYMTSNRSGALRLYVTERPPR
jgi:hypothetical protein